MFHLFGFLIVWRKKRTRSCCGLTIVGLLDCGSGGGKVDEGMVVDESLETGGVEEGGPTLGGGKGSA